MVVTILAIISIPAIALAAYLMGKSRAETDFKVYVQDLCQEVENYTRAQQSAHKKTAFAEADKKNNVSRL